MLHGYPPVDWTLFWTFCFWTFLAMPLVAVWSRVKNVCRQNGLLIMSVLAVVVGCLLGFFLRSKHLTEQVSRSLLCV